MPAAGRRIPPAPSPRADSAIFRRFIFKPPVRAYRVARARRARQRALLWGERSKNRDRRRRRYVRHGTDDLRAGITSYRREQRII